MPQKRTARTGTFRAVDKDGKKYTIHEFTNIIDVATRENPGGEAEGTKFLRTSDGKHVNRMEKGKYEMVFPPTSLTSDDPNAT